eukprot:3739255-Rhodomonas_salina.1
MPAWYRRTPYLSTGLCVATAYVVPPYAIPQYRTPRSKRTCGTAIRHASVPDILSQTHRQIDGSTRTRRYRT